MQSNKENVKFVVRERGCCQMFLSTKFSCVIGIQNAKVFDSEKSANDLVKNVEDPEDWEVEQIVVC